MGDTTFKLPPKTTRKGKQLIVPDSQEIMVAASDFGSQLLSLVIDATAAESSDAMKRHAKEGVKAAYDSRVIRNIQKLIQIMDNIVKEEKNQPLCPLNTSNSPPLNEMQSQVREYTSSGSSTSDSTSKGSDKGGGKKKTKPKSPETAMSAGKRLSKILFKIGVAASKTNLYNRDTRKGMIKDVFSTIDICDILVNVKELKEKLEAALREEKKNSQSVTSPNNSTNTSATATESPTEQSAGPSNAPGPRSNISYDSLDELDALDLLPIPLSSFDPLLEEPNTAKQF